MNELLFSNNDQALVSSDRVLYTASAFARSSLLHLQESGELRAIRPHTSSRSNLQSYLFFQVVDGAGELFYDGKKYSLSPNSCVFIDCHKPYSHTTDSNKLWTLRWCHFYGPTLSSIYQKYCERGGQPVFTPECSTPFLDILAKLFTVAKGDDYIRDMLINEQLSILIRLIMEQSWHPENKQITAKKASVLEVKAFLDENYLENITLDSLCSRFFISKYYLTHSFKEQFGMTINAYLQNVRITCAKQLLRFSNITVEEISSEIGISDPAYFSRLFKKIEGVSPSVYRKQW